MPQILVIEDDPDVRDVYRRILWRAGHSVLETAAGTAGLCMALEHRPPLILLDVWLPDCNGLAVLRQLKADPRTAAIPVIIITSLSGIDLMQLYSAGCAGVIPKPFRLQTFLAQVESCLK